MGADPGSEANVDTRRLRFDLGSPVGVFLWSRAAIWLAAVFALLEIVPHGNPAEIHRDDPHLVHDLGYFVDVWARWDSYWFVRVAEHGYDAATGTPAFFPLYPGLVALLGRVLGAHYVLAGVIVSLLATLVAFVLLERLAEQLTDRSTARRAVVYLAVFPMALFLQAVYSEGLFLALAIGAFLAAERGRWPLAGVATGLALLTRPTGAAVLAGLAVLAWQSPARSRALAWLGSSLALFAVYPLILWQQIDDAFAFTDSERYWHRETPRLGPLGGLLDTGRAAWAAVKQLTVGSNEHWFWVQESPDHVAAINLESTAFFVLYVVLAVLAWRRLGAAYGVMSLVCVVIPLMATTDAYPLLAMPRYGLAAFPIFIALATLGRSQAVDRAIIGVSSVLLGVATVQWALWQWVS